MVEHRKNMLDLLRNNGFARPEKWIEYAIRHHFTHVRAERLKACPDCAGHAGAQLGQFVYYSNLVRLQTCSSCGLIFSDTHIDPLVIQEHFEQAYKDEEYFSYQRRKVFQQLADTVDAVAPKKGRVLDIGGAKGHLMAFLKQLRPDLSTVVNDLSADACEFAAAQFNLETIVGDVRTLEKIDDSYDVIVMSDVAYYEPKLKRLWDLIPRLLTQNGTVIIRVPNKLPLISLWQNQLHLMGLWGEMQNRVRFFNPEHLYIFSRQYLSHRLKKIGFLEVETIPSVLLAHKKKELLQNVYYNFTKKIFNISSGKLILTPSMFVIGKKLQKDSDCHRS